MPPRSQAPTAAPTAPRDYLQLLHSILSHHQADALVLTDTAHEYSLFVARNPDAALRFIQQDSELTRQSLLAVPDLSDAAPDAIPSAAPRSDCQPSQPPSLRQRPSQRPSQLPAAIPDSDASPNPSDRTGSDLSDEDPVLPAPKRLRLQQDPPTSPSSPASPPASQPLLFTVTSRNRDRLRRKARAEQAEQDRADNPDLVPCLPKAKSPEETALRDTLAKHYAQEVTWLMAQPASPATISTALQMITNAKAIGNAQVIQSWKAICTHWRTHGTLTTISLHAYNPPSSQTLATPDHLRDAAPSVQLLYRVFQAVNQSVVDGALQLMFHRRYFADLFNHYQLAETALAAEPSDAHRSRGVTNAALVKQRLFLSLYPEYTACPTPHKDPVSKKAWNQFHKMLERGRRWLYFRDQTNPGIFALIPDSVSNSWVERELPFNVFCTWVNLVCRYNQTAIDLGKAMLPGLQHALSGGTMPDRKIRLEITDVEDLEGYSDTSILFREVDEESTER